MSLRGVLTIREPALPYYLPLVVYAKCVAKVIARHRSQVCHRAVMRYERVEVDVITCSRPVPDYITCLIDPLPYRVTAANRSQIRHFSSLPQKRVRSLISRK